MKKFVTVLLAVLLVLGLAACAGGGGTTDDDGPHVLRIGLVGAFNVHWYTIQEMVAEDNIQLELVYFSDFAIPNRALDAGDLDLNAFQHKMFLANDITTNGYEIQYIADTFIAPMNIFRNPERISALADIQDGHTIAIPSDPTNGGRALRLLEAAGLIVLGTPEGQNPTVLDISERIVDINIIEGETSMLPHMLPDVEAAIISNPQAMSAGIITDEYSIFREDITGPAAANLTNVIVVRTADLEEDGLRARLFEAIVRAHHTDRVRDVFIEEYQGALVPVW
ncbi:MAG: MetQ/NlpA family ABC transporter substrate-binding protein [Oscillospiraceae bacterium]|nr:MetQ/NlpA family ABC transporter substrate-binding protein [Oscillospiraceae bacterium]